MQISVSACASNLIDIPIFAREKLRKPIRRVWRGGKGKRNVLVRLSLLTPSRIITNEQLVSTKLAKSRLMFDAAATISL